MKRKYILLVIASAIILGVIFTMINLKIFEKPKKFTTNFGVTFLTEKGELLSSVTDYKGTEDFNCKLKISNNSDREIVFNCSIMANYEKTQFKVDNHILNNLNVSLDGDSEKVFDILIDSKYLKLKKNFVILNVLPDSNMNTCDKILVRGPSILYLVNNLNSKVDNVIPEVNIANSDNLLSNNSEIKYDTVSILERDSNTENLKMSNFMNLISGEKVTTNIYIDKLKNVNDCLIYLTINNLPVEVNGETFLYCKKDQNKVSINEVEFKAPVNPGKYEMVVVCVPNPWIGFKELSTEILRSERVTLIVE
jgi:hypothetical protein